MFNDQDYWVVRSNHVDRHASQFATEAEAFQFAQTGDVLAHIQNGKEIHYRPVVK